MPPTQVFRLLFLKLFTLDKEKCDFNSINTTVIEKKFNTTYFSLRICVQCFSLDPDSNGSLNPDSDPGFFGAYSRRP